MSDNTIYRLIEPYQYEQEIKKSIFLAHVVPVASEEQAQEWLQKLRVPEATHNCWAYRIGQKYRSDDDGEPSGTAGRPILQIIEKQNFDQVLILVIRWFGGIKLGAGGLIRAYGGTAAECLRQAPRAEYIPQKTASILCSFSDHALLKARIVEYDAQIISEEFGAEVEMKITVPEDTYVALYDRVLDLTRGQAVIIEDG
ncbi:YigZ family protein [Commensalibacter papalotli (ex Botero et al. 2024)]|uniref:IMPACT (Imprinted ancient) protein family (YIH1) (PDB:1VI7) (PUBMED:15126500) n=1 Tax=Commensalibacter papalotli (ex Botero et al. 2024) TaxID=2972766 RepID=A0ABN8WFR2_9PROT|nr:YigZ family protein [Commensalibacter papalotli (ex Botero et al. 2024)]CAI3940086.1 IMPACT (imprinted ancient) protein family (YIH1) (PDB:1VI7) (PUBMED:15126500) [Commensalibacter papalotli (ex Botero et al. 2024)]CAI3950945.1 IMPACT (imprinted ancient) protein family (YIH1) (PDB:1VI7) (PUBMED:15126500) [Commensalibacter papalotli (ex Botero et al. 2024)]